MAAGLGFAGWAADALVGLLFFFPLVVLHRARPAQVFVFAFAYYLAVSYEAVSAIHAYYGGPLAAAFGLWLAHQALLALPWAGAVALARRFVRPGLQTPVAALTGFASTLVPPWTWLSWANPVFVGGHAFPGLGLASFLLGLVLMAALALVFDRSRRAFVWLAAIALALPLWGRVPSDARILAFSPRDGAFDPSRGLERNRRLAEAAEALASVPRTRVGVLPEGYAGTQRDSIRAALWEPSQRLARQGQVLLYGVLVHTEDGRLDNVLWATGAYEGPVYRARIPVPLSVLGYRITRDRAHLGESPVRPLPPGNGHYVLFSLCWENYLFSHFLHAFHPAHPAPQALISASNLWMVPEHGMAWRVQKMSSEAVAKALRVSVYWSVNS